MPALWHYDTCKTEANSFHRESHDSNINHHGWMFQTQSGSVWSYASIHRLCVWGMVYYNSRSSTGSISQKVNLLRCRADLLPVPSGWGHPLSHVLALPCLGSILDCHFWDFYIYLWESDTTRSSNCHIWGCLYGKLVVSGTGWRSGLFVITSTELLLKWKSAKPSSHSQCVHNGMSFLKLEKLKYSSRGSSKRFDKVWCPFLLYFKEKFTSWQQT